MKSRKFKISSHFLDHDMLHKSEGVSYDNEGERSYELLEIISKKIHSTLPKRVNYGTKKYKNLEAKGEKITDYKEYVKHLNKYYLKPFTWIEVTHEEYEVWYKYWLEYYYDDTSIFWDIRSQYPKNPNSMFYSGERPKWLPTSRTPDWAYIEAKKLLYRMDKFFGQSKFSEDHRAGAKMKFAHNMVKEMGAENALNVVKSLKDKPLN